MFWGDLVRLALDVFLVIILGHLGVFLETELVHNVEDLNGSIITASVLVTTLSRGVGALELDVFVRLLRNVLAVALEEDTFDLLEIEGVRDKLIVREDIL